MIGALGALAAAGLGGCASIPEGSDPRLPVALGRVIGFAPSDFRWVGAVDGSRHEGFWRPHSGEDLYRGTLGLFLGESTSTGVLTDEALVIARPSIFSVGYRVLQRIPIERLERATLVDNSLVVLKQRDQGAWRDYVRVLAGDPWLAGELLFRPEPALAADLVRQLQARIGPFAPRWRPEAMPRAARPLVALLVPHAVPLVSVPPPPGIADKGMPTAFGSATKGMLDAGSGLGAVSPPAGLSLGLAALLTAAAGSVAGAVRGTMRELSEPEARAARDRRDALQKAGLPSLGAGLPASELLLAALLDRLPPASGDDPCLVPLTEAQTGEPDFRSAAYALTEDGFGAVWRLEVVSIEFRVISAGAEASTMNPNVSLRVSARLRKLRPGGEQAEPNGDTELADDSPDLPLSAWTADGAATVRESLAAACGRLAARLAEGVLAGVGWLPPRP